MGSDPEAMQRGVDIPPGVAGFGRWTSGSVRTARWRKWRLGLCWGGTQTEMDKLYKNPSSSPVPPSFNLESSNFFRWQDHSFNDLAHGAFFYRFLSYLVSACQGVQSWPSFTRLVQQQKQLSGAVSCPFLSRLASACQYRDQSMSVQAWPSLRACNAFS